MTLENVRLSDGNACTDRDHQFVSSFSLDEQSVIEVDKSSGVVQNTWPADTLFTYVYSLCFDGFYWWTLEQQTGGFIVSKWRKKDGIFAELVSTFSYFGVGKVSRALAVEYYSSTLTAAASAGSYSVEVDDASYFQSGGRVVIGPSTVVGYTGDYSEAAITGITGNTLSVSPALLSSQHSGASIYSTKAFWVFTDGVGGNGDLIKYSASTGNFLLSNSGFLYSGVTSADFFSGKVLFQKGNEIFWITPDTLAIYKVMAVDNLEADRSTVIPIADMYGFDAYLYRLQEKTSYEDSGVWYDEEWTSFNTVSSKTVPEVFMIALSAEKSVLHAVSAPYVTTASSTIYCTVYDQYFSPVSGEVVNFTTTAGNLTSTQETTDSNGFCSTVYLGGSTIGLVTITATT